MSDLLDKYSVDPRSGALLAKSPSPLKSRQLEKQVKELINEVLDLKSRVNILENEISNLKSSKE